MTAYTGLRLEPVAAFGITLLEHQTIYWNGLRQFFYPVGQHFRQFQVESLNGQFLFPERFGANCAEIIKIIDVAVTTNSHFIAVSEIFRPNHGILSIYDSETQVTHVHLRHDQCSKFVSLSFSSDDSMIAALHIYYDPEQSLFICNLLQIFHFLQMEILL
jgi:hypothetical protein